MLTPTKLKELCHQYGLTPSKKYGQNYLIQDHPIKKMIEAADISSKDTVIEIGPGFGVLTFALAEKAGKVIAFEIEKKLTDYWGENKPENLEIIWGNALNELKSYKVHEVYKVVANLPYQITSNVIRTLLELENKPGSITIMVQKEVAERICARLGEMSLLAISVQYYGKPQIVSIVTKGNFWPEPKVDSAILHIKTLGHENMKTLDDKEFFRMVKIGFGQKRKQLWHNLSKGLKIDGEKIKTVLLEVCGNEKVRAEELSLENWQEIVEKIKKLRN